MAIVIIGPPQSRCAPVESLASRSSSRLHSTELPVEASNDLGLADILQAGEYILRFTKRFIPRKYKLPILEVGKAHDTTDEDFVSWLHVPVSIKQRFLSEAVLYNARIYIVIDVSAARLFIFRVL